MVDLGIPRPRLVTTEAPQDRTPGREMAASAAAIGQGLRNVGQGLEDIAVPLAERQGREDAAAAIQLDENGKIQIATPQTSFILGRAGNAYADAKQTEMLVAGRTQVDADLLEIRQRNEGDPEGYRKDAGEYLNARRNANVAGIGQQTFDYGLRNMQQHYTNLVDQKATKDFQQTTAVFSGRMAQLQGQEDSLVMQQVSSGPEWDRIQAEKAEIRNQMQANPRFNYDARLRTLDEGADKLRQGGLVVAYEGRNRIRAGEPPDVVVRDIEERLSKMGMSQEQVQKFVGIARQNVAGMAAARAANRQKAEADADLAIASLKGGETLGDGQVAEIVGRLAGNGGERKAADFLAQRTLHEEIWPILQNPDASADERAYAMGRLKELREEGIVVPGSSRGGSLNAYMNARAGVNIGGINPQVQQRVASLQEQAQAQGLPFTVTSGFRDHAHNARVGGARGSQHTHGNAVDIALPKDPEQARKLVGIIAASGVPGMGYYPGSNSIHIDYRQGGAATWGTDYTSGSVGKGGDPEIWRLISSRNVDAGAPVDAPRVATRYPVRETVVKEVQRVYDGNLEPIVQRLIKSYESGNPPTQQDMAAFREMYPMSSKSDEKGNLAKLFRLDEEFITKNGLPGGETLTAFSNRLNEAEKRGELDPQGVMVARVAREAREEQDRLRKDDPLELGRRTAARANTGDLYGRRGTIDWTNPDAMIGELSLRRHQSDMIRAHDPLASQMPLYADDRKQLAQTLPALDGNQARTVLATLGNTFTREQMSALMGDKEIRDAIVGMTRNPDPAKMQAGFTFLKKQHSANPMQFETTFGKETESRLAYWETLLSSVPEAQAVEMMIGPRDATTGRIQKERAEYADAAMKESGINEKIFKEISREGAGFMRYYGFAGFSKPMSETETSRMAWDYADAFKFAYVQTGNEEHAKAHALKTTLKRWGESASTGRLMRFPPERQPGVDMVDGSHDWLKTQLQGDLLKALGVDAERFPFGGEPYATKPLTPNEQKAFAVMNGEVELVADPKTESDIANGRPPSYKIIVRRPDGLFDVMAANNNPGSEFRWVPDHKRAREEARLGLQMRDNAAKLMREGGVTMMPGANYRQQRSSVQSENKVADYSSEADLPALGAQESQLVSDSRKPSIFDLVPGGPEMRARGQQKAQEDANKQAANFDNLRAEERQQLEDTHKRRIEEARRVMQESEKTLREMRKRHGRKAMDER